MAEELVGPSVFSFNLTVETPIDIDEMIYITSPNDLPFIHGINSDGMPVLQASAASDTTIYWLEEEVPLPRSSLLNAIPNGTDVTTTLAAGEAVKFAIGDQVLIDDEIIEITGVNTTTEVLTFIRGAAAVNNTTAAAHLAGAEMLGMGSLLIEGAVGSTNYQGRDKFYNIEQIFSKKLNMSGTEQVIRKYGVPSELARQLANAAQNFGVGMEQAFLYGRRFSHATSFRRQMGGLKYYIASNVDTADTWLTVGSIEERQQAGYDLGSPGIEFIMAQPAAFGALNNTLGAERIQTVTIDDARRGRRRARTVMTQFGDVTLVWNRWVKKTDAFGLIRGNVQKRNLRPMQTVRLAKTDDTDSYMIVCECSLQVKGESHMAMWTGLDPSSAMPADLV